MSRTTRRRIWKPMGPMQRFAAVVVGCLLSLGVFAQEQTVRPQDSTARENVIAPREEAPVAKTTLNAGDLVFVDIARHPELSTSTQIDTGGSIVLPHVGPVKIGGMSETEAQDAIATSLLRILRQKPQVMLSRNAPAVTANNFRTSEMTTELIPLQNANAENLANALQGMTSAGGNISYDPDTYTLIITDTPETVRNIMSVVNRLDNMKSLVTQVRIEAKIAEVKVNAMKELGVKWFAQGDEAGGGYYPTGVQGTGLQNLLGTASDANANEQVNLGGGGTGGGRSYVEEGLFDRRVVLPVNVGQPGQFFFGLLNSDIDLGILLNALVANDEAEILANPSILAVNHTKAQIRSTERFPFTEYGVSDGRDTFGTSFLDLGIKLMVTPHVRTDDKGIYVNLELEPEVSYPTGNAEGVPTYSVRSSKNIANVRDSQTLVIGGIYRNQQRNVDSGLPGLRKAPIIGHLFSHVEKEQNQTELMVFVTPTVHDSPETVTWDRMLDIQSASNAPSASSVLKPVPTRAVLPETRKE